MVDRWEVQIERECVRVLALHQPVASDLRRVAAVLKINGDLHRLYDLARHIAKRVKKLAGDPRRVPIPQAIENLGLAALAQVHDSLDALTESDVSLAQSVIAADQRIDRDYRPSRSSSSRRSSATPTGSTPGFGWSTPRETSSGSPTTPPTSPSRSSTSSRGRSSGIAPRTAVLAQEPSRDPAPSAAVKP